MKRALMLFCVWMLVLACAPPASATVWTLTDQNSTVFVDTANSAGMFDWIIDGVDVLYQQWFWYRIGSTGVEHPINSISAPTETLLDPSTLKFSYTNSQLKVEILYALVGGSTGSFASDVAETIRITNRCARYLDLHFFQYSDFDLGAGAVDRVDLDSTDGHADQWPAAMPGAMLSETVLAPAPNHREANTFANTLNALNDGLPTTLNDTALTAGPGDVTWAFQWDRMLAPGGVLIISKDKNIAPLTVPEPAAIALFGCVLILAARKLRTHAV